MMSVNDILQQVKALSRAERDELVAQIVHMDSENTDTRPEPLEGNWGQMMKETIESIPPVELRYPDIEDPVEWVKQLRKDMDDRRRATWDDVK